MHPAICDQEIIKSKIVPRKKKKNQLLKQSLRIPAIVLIQALLLSKLTGSEALHFTFSFLSSFFLDLVKLCICK